MQFTDVTYRFAKTYCALDQVPHVAAAVCDDLTLDPADYRGATGGVIVANANAPMGFAVLPSAANFVFDAHPAYDAAFLAAHLRDKGILVRHFRQNRIHNRLRITVGTTAQCDALLVALAALI